MARPKPQLQAPSSIEEYRRLSHAFLAGSPVAAEGGHCVWVVASTVGPLRRIQAICRTKEEAEQVKAGPVNPRLRWSTAEKNNRVIYEICFPARTGRARAAHRRVVDAIDPYAHGMTDLLEMDVASGHEALGRGLSDVDSITLTVNWKGGQVTTYAAPFVPDAIFITSGSVELFALPMYAGAYGMEYVDELRRVLPFGQSKTRRGGGRKRRK